MISRIDLAEKRSGIGGLVVDLLKAVCPALLILLVSPPLSAAEDHTLAVSDFQQRDLSRWQKEEFDGRTDYSFVEDDSRGWVLKAHSNGDALGLIREMRVDLTKTPYLNWSWKVEKFPGVDNDKTKASDDYPARVYVIFKTGRWFWNTKALNYVWSTTLPVGDSWPNAFASEARMVVVRSGDNEVGRWVTEKRNIRKDIAAFFGTEIEVIEAVALMSDTDNSGTEAVAYYDKLFFSAQ